MAFSLLFLFFFLIHGKFSNLIIFNFFQIESKIKIKKMDPKILKRITTFYFILLIVNLPNK